MTPELQNLILETLKETKEFALAQAPDLIQQYLAYERMDAIGWALFAVFILILFIGIFVSADGNDGDLARFFGVTFGSIAFLGLISCAITIYQINHFPKAYLLTHLTHTRCGK